MASGLKNLSDYQADAIPDASAFQFSIVVSSYNQGITSRLLDGCRETLLEHGAREENITLHVVPGAYELTSGANFAAQKDQPNAVICIGCVIKGETKHDEYINHAVAEGLVQLNIKHNIPFIFGLLTPSDEEQAYDRAGGRFGNKGVEAAVAGIMMAEMYANR